ncbi:MAG: MmcQ/YjbR family DNA-binding protein [Clostridia bacterium]|nr:MmcQ/YjbR family DNA-binding protein [Clostridia bacterium]
MNRDEVFSYIQSQYGICDEYPFDMDDVTAVFRHAGNRKWFAIVMRVSAVKIGRNTDETVDILNVKADPVVIGSFLSEKGFYPAYHMNKNHWLTIALDGSADDEKTKLLIDMSFSATGEKRRRKHADKEHS